MISFVSTNVKSHIDFEQRTGEFTANELGHLTQFPYNQFASTLDHFKWDMDKKTIELTPTGRQESKEYVFVSQNPAQQGLRFQSTNALFDMNDGTIYADEVPFIDIADSRVFPHEGKVTIKKDAEILPLTQAKMLANRENKYHELYDCKLYIAGRLDIAGSAHYVFKDKYETGQVVFFDKMRVLPDTSTVEMSGYISDSLNFTISPRIGYKGNAILNSKEPFLSFKGFVKPLHTFEDIKSQWFRYKDQPNPANVIVDASEPRNKDRRKVNLGISLSPNDSVAVYPNFFGQKFSFVDLDLTIDTGVFFYDETIEAFVVGDSNKLLQGAKRGNVMTFDDKAKTIKAEGVFDFGLDFGEEFNAQTVGEAVRTDDDSTFLFNMMMMMDLKLPEECWVRMGEIFDEKVSGNSTASLDNDWNKKYLAELITDDKKYDKVIKDVEEFGELKQLDVTKRDFVISGMKFYYSHTLNAFVSTEPIELVTLKGKNINRKLNSRLMIERRRSGPRVALYIEVTKYDYFYFEFQRGNMFVYSTDKDFNLLLRSKSGKVSSRNYRVRPSSPLKVTRHIDMIDQLESE